MMMSFFGSVENLMKRSGIEDQIMKNCAKNTLSHIMAGKAVPRALSTLSLTEAALMSLFLEQSLDDDKNENKILRIN